MPLWEMSTLLEDVQAFLWLTFTGLHQQRLLKIMNSWERWGSSERGEKKAAGSRKVREEEKVSG